MSSQSVVPMTTTSIFFKTQPLMSNKPLTLYLLVICWSTPHPQENWHVKSPSLNEKRHQISKVNGEKAIKSIQMTPRTSSGGSYQSLHFSEDCE